MADPKSPTRDYQLGELCEALGVLPIDLGTLLQRYGFAIVSEADRKVLEACAAFPIEALHSEFNAQPLPTLELRKRAAEASWQWATAELARRSGT